MLRVRGFHPLWPHFPARSTLSSIIVTWSYNPASAKTDTVWALPRSLATTRGIISLFSSPGGNEMFQFPPFASTLNGYMSFTHVGCPIRKSPDQRLFAPSRSLSQLITSFFASESLGIRHAPLLTSFLWESFVLHKIRIAISHTSFAMHFENLFFLDSIYLSAYNMSKIFLPKLFSLAAGQSLAVPGFFSDSVNKLLLSLSMEFPSFSALFVFKAVYVENNGFEPLTLCVQGRCSSQLS